MSETQDYLDIMAGKKRLEIEYKEDDIFSGYTAHGLSARIIESLHCGQYIDNWGFLIDREFEDGDIDKMKRHFFEWKEMEEIQNQLKEKEEEAYEDEKKKLLDGVHWTHTEHYEIDGNQSFSHSITIDGHTYILREKKVAGMGKMVVPEYEFAPGVWDEPLAEWIDGRWCWTYFAMAREEMVPMKAAEERAFLIVKKYGML